MARCTSPSAEGGLNLAALERAHALGEPIHKEHCTLYIFEHPEMFQIDRTQASGELARPDIRVTIDTPEDLIMAREVYAALSPEFGPTPPLREIIRYLDQHDELRQLNAHLHANSTRIWR